MTPRKRPTGGAAGPLDAKPTSRGAASIGRRCRGAIGCIAALLLLGHALSQGADRTAALHETVSWTLPYVPADTNPFDVMATAVFTHHETGRETSTELFWMGDGTYAFRFTPLRTGRWRFATHSDVPELAGLEGTVVVEPSARAGALTSEGTKFARTDDGDLVGALHHPYHLYVGSALADYSADLGQAAREVDASLDAVEAQGFQSLFMSLQHTLFAMDARSYADHDRTEPDLTAFAILDLLLLEAHERGMTVHFWLWGDERREQTPAGLPGGVNGPVDRRLQRYLAARLGPLPSWTMAYGFDLEEWASPDEVRRWAAYLDVRMQVPHLLTAREKNPRGGFEFGADKLSLVSTDDRPSESGEGCYALARRRLTSQDGHEPRGPVLFERRFVHRRDAFWSETRTRRCLWQLTLAGGAGAIWGEPFGEAGPYPTPGFYRSFFAFWERRFVLGLEPVDSGAGAWTLATPDGRQRIVYAEETATVELDLTDMDTDLPVLALDTVSGVTYDLGTFGPGTYAWSAPATSDWAIAIGAF